MPLFLFLLTVISRLPFTSKYLYHMDSGHFALALQNYDLVLHQPHPPGYFLYVMLGKLLDPFISDANTTFVLISIVFSGLTVAAIYLLGKEIFDARVGTIASPLLKELSTFNPKTTALFVGPYSFYSYRHLMLYLPAFTVYQVDVRSSETGEQRKQFGGTNRTTFLTKKIRPSKAITLFAAVFVDMPIDSPEIPQRLSVLRASSDITIVSGPIDRICDLYPQLRPIWDSGQ